MKRFCYYIILLIWVGGCKCKLPGKPIWINKTDTAWVPILQLRFTSPEKDWKACINSFAQPLHLDTSYHNDTLNLNLDHQWGITEGMAEICIYNDRQQFFYPVYLKNQKDSILRIFEYRSPKTVNPDSSLVQQLIYYKMDLFRNPVKQSHYRYFTPDIMHSLFPKAGTYRAFKDVSLSSFYILPGSCTNIPVNYFYKPQRDSLVITAGPLFDVYNNKVADGTLVAFIFNNSNATFRTEKSLLNGYATIILPVQPFYARQLLVKVNETKSDKINLNP